jgi:phage baseplate assembly protein W
MGLGSTPLGGRTILSGPLKPRNLPEARDFNDVGDYATSDGYEFISTNWVRQAVFVALFTTKGTVATDPNFGNGVPTIQAIDSTFNNKVKQMVNSALSHLIPKYVKINSIDIEVYPLGRVEYTVNYMNLYTKTMESIKI